MRIHITELEVDVLPAAWDHMGAEISTGFEYTDQLHWRTCAIPNKE